jgi:dTMP kinase
MIPLILGGLLIAIEGIDGSGKSTLAESLSHSLLELQYNVLLTKEPGATALGLKLRKILQFQEEPLEHITEYLLFAADRSDHFAKIVLPHLNADGIVVSDRMGDSSVAYQGYGRGLSIEKIKEINTWAMHGRTPDVTIYLQIPLDDALARLDSRAKKTSFEKRELLEKVIAGFEDMYTDRTDVIVIDATQSIARVHEEVLEKVIAWIRQETS